MPVGYVTLVRRPSLSYLGGWKIAEKLAGRDLLVPCTSYKSTAAEEP